MSDKISTGAQVPTVDPLPVPEHPPEPAYAKPSISVVTLLIFVVVYAGAWVAKDNNTLVLMAGAIIAMAQQVIGYWLGSSAGSTAKSATIAKVVPPVLP